MHDNAKEKGFTIIELIMVIILIGVLSAVALPKYVDLGKSAKRAVNEDIFRKFAEQMDKAHVIYEIKKNQGKELDLDLDGVKELLFSDGFPVGAKIDGDPAFKELTDAGNTTGTNGDACINIFKAVITAEYRMKAAEVNALSFENCGGEETDICARGTRAVMSNKFECQFIFMNTYDEKDANFGDTESVEGFNYYVNSGISLYAYVYGQLITLDPASGLGFADPENPSLIQPVIVLGNLEGIKALEGGAAGPAAAPATSSAPQPTDPIVMPPTEPIVMPPTEPIVMPPTEPIVMPPTEPIVMPPTDPVVMPPLGGPTNP